MSRLDSFIRRLEAQRACLDWAVSQIQSLSGPVLELGLGNGRTYDHLRSRLPDREIFAFDRRLAAHPGSMPPRDRLILGDFAETLPAFAQRLARPAALVHADFGSGNADETDALGGWLGPALAPLLAPGAIIASDQPLAIPGSAPLALPPGVPEHRYFLYRRQ